VSLLGRIFGTRAAEHYRSGMTAFNAGRFAVALAAFERALELDRDASDPIRGLSLFYAAESATHLGLQALLANDPGTALDYFGRAQEWNAQFPDLHYFTAAAHAQRSALHPSLESLQRALALDPEHLEARCLLAVVLHDLGQAEAAAAALERARARAAQVHAPLQPFTRTLLEAHQERVPGLGTLAHELEAASSAPPAAKDLAATARVFR